MALPTRKTSPAWCRRHDRLGHITLNRPEAMNALDLPLIQQVTEALLTWANDPAIAAVLIDGAGERGFCAGGDIRAVRESALGDPGIATALWQAEYQLDALIAHYPLPIVAVMDGVTMGGGVGLGAHAAVRIVTERTVLAMPEVRIGLAPDVGSAFLLARAPDELGTHLALTGTRIGAADAIACGLADHALATDRLPALLDALVQAPTSIPEIVVSLAAQPDRSTLADQQWLAACYRFDTVEEIMDALRHEPAPDAAHALDAIGAGSPTALKVTLRALRSARAMSSVDECLVQDFRLSRRFLPQHDLREGIRAAIIDKDRAPRWHPATLAEVTEETVEAYFAPLADDLDLPVP